MSGRELSIVIPARNEAPNVPRLVQEVESALPATQPDFELIIVDDASGDGTAAAFKQFAGDRPWLRILQLAEPRGQSAAMAAGIAAARGRYIATMDADLQNDPADLPVMLDLLQQHNVDLVQGDRSASRRDTWLRRRAAGAGRLAQRLILGEPVRDTGCSARVMRAELARKLPLHYRGMHRFIPALSRRMGAKILEHPVSHRPRAAGRSNYGVGVLSRGLTGLIDCFAVRWMARRIRETSAVELALAVLLLLPAAAGAGVGLPPIEIELSDRLADLRIEEGRVIVETPGGPRAVAAEEYLRALEARQRGGERGRLYQLFDITGRYSLAWIAAGFAGQLLFAGRMLVQWIASERRRQSVVPPVFWWMSLAGASMLLAYFIWRKDVVGVFGQAMGWVIYARNLRLIYRVSE